jgi:hypothetical protein
MHKPKEVIIVDQIAHLRVEGMARALLDYDDDEVMNRLSTMNPQELALFISTVPAAKTNPSEEAHYQRDFLDITMSSLVEAMRPDQKLSGFTMLVQLAAEVIASRKRVLRRTPLDLTPISPPADFTPCDTIPSVAS